MKIKITQSFVKINHAAFSPGEILTVPDDIAAEWIEQNKAISVEEPTATEQRIEDKATIRKRIRNKLAEKTSLDN